MDQNTESVLGASPPRPLTDDERQFLHAWIAGTEVLSAFLSERQTDDPAIFGQIVVFRRATKRHLYLIHCPQGANCWIVLSAVERENLGYFSTLRAALNYISPFTSVKRVDGPASADKDPARRFERALRDAQATIRGLQHRLDAASQSLQTSQAELAGERQVRRQAEETLRAALQAVNEWRSRGR